MKNNGGDGEFLHVCVVRKREQVYVFKTGLNWFTVLVGLFVKSGLLTWGW